MTATNRHHRNCRRVKPGSHLSAIAALGVIESDAELTERHRVLTRAGYILTKTVRPYYAKSGFISFRLVWRRRRPETNITWSVTWRVALGAFMRETA